MKLFKRIYYPVMAVLLVFLAAVSFVDSVYGGNPKKLGNEFYDNVNAHIGNIAESSHNSYNPAQQEKVSDYIVDSLQNVTTRVDAGKDDDGNDTAVFAKNGDTLLPTLVVQDTVLREETVRAIDRFEDNYHAVAKEVGNIVVAIPGTDSQAGAANNTYGKAVMVMAHYDSRPEGPGASDNAVAAASMLETINRIVTNNLTFKNDLLFVFTDAEEEGMFGAYAFKYQFKGLGDIYDRVGLGGNFDALGNKGSLVMFQTSDKNAKLVSEYARMNGSTFTSSIANFVYNSMSNFTDFEIFGDKPSLNFANVGGNDVYHTALDTPQNVSQSVVRQQGDMMNRFITRFGDYDLDNLSSNTNAVFFSYLDVVTIVYPFAVAFVMGGIILGLMLAIILLNRRRKAFSLGKVGLGIVVQLLTMAAVLVSLYIGYYIVCLLLTGFGVIPLHAIGRLTYSSVGLMISVMILAAALACAFYIILKKAFNVKAADVVRGNAVLWAILGAVLSFAAPALSYFFAIVGILQLTVMLLTVIFKEKFRNKFGMDIERLFLYVWPMILALPMLIPIMQIASTVLELTMLPAIMMLFMLMIGSIAPYCNYIKPAMDKLLAKAPKRTIRVERMVTERIEDRAKKGKFTEVTHKKVTNEKVEWRYLNRVGIAAVSLIATVMIILFTAFGGSYSSAIAGGYKFSDSIYNDALIYVWNKDSSTVTTSLEIRDLMAYKYMRYALDGLVWDSEKDAYVKTGVSSLIAAGDEPTVSKSTLTYDFKPYNTRSQVTVTVKNTAAVTKVTITNEGNSIEEEHVNDGKSEMTFSMPYAMGQFKMTFEGISSDTQLDFEYVEHCMDQNVMKNLDEWRDLESEYPSDSKVGPYIKNGIVLNYKFSM